jgi:ppGpp synthetase/RelA/SpoT-type nucleotidyltranferase
MKLTPLRRSAVEALASRLAAGLREVLADGPVVPQHGLSYRVKLDSAITRKTERKNLSSWRDLNDLIGLRVVVRSMDAVPHARAAVLRWAQASQLTVTVEDDRFTAPGLGGYRALHLDLLGSAPDLDGGQPLGIEVQITTWLQHFHGMLSHDTYYVGDHARASSDLARLERFSRMIHRLDRAFARSFPWKGGQQSSRQ